jgi:hypothetical protein
MAQATPPTDAPHARRTDRLRPHLDSEPLRQRPHIKRIPEDEAIYAFYHRHPIVFLRGLRWPIAILIIVLLSMFALSVVGPGDASGWVATLLSALSALFVVGILVAAFWALYTYFDWRADYLLISERRIVVNIERPGIHTELREAPMGKVQNVITHHAPFNEMINKSLKVARLVIDTAGLGQIIYDDISEKDADDAQTIILDLQKGVRAASAVPREQYRREYVHSIVTGATPPAQPRNIQVRSYPRSGYDFFNSLFPRQPMREGQQVVWHKHWWFLLKAELMPVGLVLLYELTNLVVALVGGALGLQSNPVLDLLAWIRPVLLLILLPLILWQWEDWRNDKYIVNKDSLISLSTLPFGLSETRKQTEVRRVVDATVTVDGPIAKLLGFGDVVMKTPGEATKFDFEDVPHPFDVHQEIMNRLEAQREQEQAQWDRDIQEWLRAYVEERRAEPAPQAPPPAQDWWS